MKKLVIGISNYLYNIKNNFFAHVYFVCYTRKFTIVFYNEYNIYKLQDFLEDFLLHSLQIFLDFLVRHHVIKFSTIPANFLFCFVTFLCVLSHEESQIQVVSVYTSVSSLFLSYFISLLIDCTQIT